MCKYSCNRELPGSETIVKSVLCASASWRSEALVFECHLPSPASTCLSMLGCSLYFAMHGVHPVLPFDIDEATYLVPPPDTVLTDEDLLAHRGMEFAKRQSDLDALRQCVHEAHLAHMD